MKHLQTLDREQLATEVALAELVVPAQRLETAALHAEMVLRTNHTLNLTAITDPTDVVSLHVVDSLLPVGELDDAPEGPFVDLGSGGGFPGVSLAAATGRSVVLLESIGKKSAFLGEVLHALELEGESVGMRSEEYARLTTRRFSAVTARAVADLPVLVELAAPLLALGGRLIALKGDLGATELQRGDAAAAILGMGCISVRRAELPRVHAARTIVVYEKRSETPEKFPRRPGMAAKRPLA